MAEKCGELVPRVGSGVGVPVERGKIGECLLKDGHEGDHLVKTPLGYYCWITQEDFCFNDDEICNCECIECYVYYRVSNAEASKILKKFG